VRASPRRRTRSSPESAEDSTLARSRLFHWHPVRVSDLRSAEGGVAAVHPERPKGGPPARCNTTGRPKPVNQSSWPTDLGALFHNQTRRPAGACAPQEESHVASSSDKTRAAATGARPAD
jgi:hypothetical protein